MTASQKSPLSIEDQGATLGALQPVYCALVREFVIDISACPIEQHFSPCLLYTSVLCLADSAAAPAIEDRQLLRAIAGHASIALENACLFTRMQQANRHWLDVFDAISDFIVVHDEQHNILLSLIHI